MSAIVGVSMKMYFGHAQTLQWCADVARIAREHEAVASGAVEVFVIPTYPAIPGAIAAFAGTAVGVGAQDVGTEDTGAYTGEVSAVELAEIGCRVVEVGHAERRRLFGETDDVVAAKTAAALRNGLTPVLCVGETERTSAEDAAPVVVEQVRSALATAGSGRVIVAYEPVWAIGAAAPASADHIRTVARAIRAALTAGRADGSAVIYGGSAGPGLLGELGADVDGLFLGRFAHDPAALAAVIDEAAAHDGGPG